MRPDKVPASPIQPQTRSDLHAWVRQHLQLPSPLDEGALFAAIDAVFARHEQLWQTSKDEAIQALSAGFAEKMARAKTELSAKDATVSSISRYFEALVADLTDKSHRDPKTKLMNFGPMRSPSASARRSSAMSGLKRIAGWQLNPSAWTSVSFACGSAVSPNGASSLGGLRRISFNGPTS